MGYTKNIAVIRGLKDGFSADGGPLSGLVKVEKYGTNLKAEVSLINFAPLSEGRYVAAVSDGKHVCILDGLSYDGQSDVETGNGFASLVCFVNGTVSPIASAVCGQFHSAALGIREEIERAERANLLYNPAEKKFTEQKYEDEALAQENYYEYEQADEDCGNVREDTQKEKDGLGVFKDEKTPGAFKEGTAGGLARGECFYERMKGEISKVLASYPCEQALESLIENSSWVRITYGGEKFYVFGVIYSGGNPQYICYGVPADGGENPPESLAGLASFIPSSAENDGGGYWVMYQDASTGASVKIQAN